MLRRRRLALVGPFVVTLCPELDCGLEALPLLRVGLLGGRCGVALGWVGCCCKTCCKTCHQYKITDLRHVDCPRGSSAYVRLAGSRFWTWSRHDPQQRVTAASASVHPPPSREGAVPVATQQANTTQHGGYTAYLPRVATQTVPKPLIHCCICACLLDDKQARQFSSKFV